MTLETIAPINYIPIVIHFAAATGQPGEAGECRRPRSYATLQLVRDP
jgi:hypothetical protein